MSPAPRGQGSNSTNLRQFNERVILAALRRIGEASKADLARLVNLTNNTAGSIVRDLEAQQLVRVGAKRQGGRGGSLHAPRPRSERVNSLAAIRCVLFGFASAHVSCPEDPQPSAGRGGSAVLRRRHAAKRSPLRRRAHSR